MAEFGEDLTKEFRRVPRVTALKSGIPTLARLASLWEQGFRRWNPKSAESDRPAAAMAVCLAIANPKGGVGKSSDYADARRWLGFGLRRQGTGL